MITSDIMGRRGRAAAGSEFCEEAAVKKGRNHQGIRLNRRFTTQDARIKLQSLYPSIQGIIEIPRPPLPFPLIPFPQGI